MSPLRNRVAVMHGVNLDMLGRRDPAHYGTVTLAELEQRVVAFGLELELEVECFHTNSEAEFVEHLHGLPTRADGIVLNPGAWTHYSWAIHDAVELFTVPVVEVHLSDVDAREEWRRVSVLDGLVAARFVGLGPDGYREALQFLAEGTA